MKSGSSKVNICHVVFAALTLLALVVVYYVVMHKGNDVLRTVSFYSSERFFDRLAGEPFDEYGYDGIDVSRHNGKILWDSVATSTNTKFVYIKATQGGRLADKCYYENLRDAKAAGLLVGSYHFFSSKASVMMQFLNFKNHVSKDDQDLVPVLDVEDGGISEKWSREQLQDSVAAFASLVKSHYGKLPVIYSNEHFYNTMLAPRFNNHYLFIANYNGRAPSIIEDGKANLWQYTERGHIRGVGERVDLIKLVNGMSVENLLLER